MRTILILEDNAERIEAFQKIIAHFKEPFDLVVWRDAPSMIAECETYFPSAALIGLDHDLNPLPGATRDPGTGVDVAQFLGDFMPVCPVLIHSSNTERVYSMHNELRFAGWMVDRVGPIGSNWIETSWLRTATRLLTEHQNTWNAALPTDHNSRVDRMKLSLNGLGLGDSLGEMLSHQSHSALRRLETNDLPPGPWFHTDDTEMAISIVAILKSHGFIDPDALSKRFARRFERDPERGYGKMTRLQMRELMTGASWRDTAANAFNGQGSMGNGSAMRIPPLGAYFADDFARCVAEARKSSIVTHTHPEAIAGAIATTVAAAATWQLRQNTETGNAKQFFEAILDHTPESQVHSAIRLASAIPSDTPIQAVAKLLGNGAQVTAPDTVPFCIWMAAHHRENFIEALGKTISAGGDCDTNAAIVAGIVALDASKEGIPPPWIQAREQIKF